MIFRPSASTRPARIRNARGFSLFEVLIALVILSVGLLGLAALQAQGLRGSSAALQRTEAVNLVADIADRMRANRNSLLDYVVDLDDDAAGGAANGCADDEINGTNAANCTPLQMAQFDLAAWKAMMGAVYEGSIAQEGASTTMFLIRVQWSDRTTTDDNGNPVTAFYETTIQF